ncbi:M48 family metalloprotease [Natrialba sp. INN-245]|nr:M48 family metalloprotease [Natrialba sp. INN-245]MWV41419.1 M48 family metalloprotease [Natrialba sp. INN-245]
MALAGVLCLALLGAVVAVALALVGVPVYGLVWYTIAVLEGIVPTPVATVVAVTAAAVSLCCIELSLRAIRRARADDAVSVGPITQGVVELAAYTLLLSSLVIALAAAPVVGAVLPAPVFALLIVLGFFYLITISYVWAARAWVRSRTDGNKLDDRSETGDWLVLGVFVVGYLSFAISELFAAVLVVAVVGVGIAAVVAPGLLESLRNRLVELAPEADDDRERDWYGLADETQRFVARLEAAPGPRPSAVAVGIAIVGLTGSYAAATVLATGTIAVGLAAVCALAFVGVHLGNAVRDEFAGDTAVLRDLADRVDLERLADGSADDERGDLQMTIARLAGQADLPAPDVRIAGTAAPAALSVGYRPSSSTIVLSRGLCESLDDRELEAVLAHELAHVANRDAAVLSALAAPGAVARVASSRYGFNPVVEPFALLVGAASRLAVGVVARAREYAADDGAVAITGDPAGLASALEALDRDLERRPREDLRAREFASAFSIVPPPWEEHRFFDRTRRFVSRTIFGTHPSTEKRIDRLRARL